MKELVKLAEEKGFTSSVNPLALTRDMRRNENIGYEEFNEIVYNLWMYELQEWLLVKCKIFVNPDFFVECDGRVYWDFEVVSMKDDIPELIYDCSDDEVFNSRSEALKAGLYESLKLR